MEACVNILPMRVKPASEVVHEPPAPELGNEFDLFVQAQLARTTGGVSPIALALAFQDWWMHLASAPGKCAELGAQWLAAFSPFAPPVEADPDDRRFVQPPWRQWPFDLYVQGFLRCQRFWRDATTGVRGVSPHHADVVRFTARQLLDMWSPSNFVATNPEVQRAALASGGRSLADGALNWRKDLCRHLAPPWMAVPEPPGPQYRPGVDVAVTPGDVVYRNELIELIQYAPQTATVYREPVLVVPSWIMKYYILDLSPRNSMVRYLVGQGHTVFMISWRNPGPDDRALGMHDYLRQGLFAALDEVRRRCAGAPAHGVGYCLGGTLLAIGAAAMANGDHGRKEDLASLTLLAAQTDFSEPGELGLFIDDSELAFLDALMWDQGYLDDEQMAASFQLLHARDLVWSRMMREYLLGTRTAPNDLMAWNADSTRLPFRMHSEYLHQLFLRNDLAEGRYHVDGRPVVLDDVTVPVYALATERDHVSPWRSVYKIHLLCDAPIDFVLASGGHNAGIVSEPGHPRRAYRVQPPLRGADGYRAPDAWREQADLVEGSWWPHWQRWLAARSSGALVAPPVAREPLEPAPGRYVLEK